MVPSVARKIRNVRDLGIIDASCSVLRQRLRDHVEPMRNGLYRWGSAVQPVSVATKQVFIKMLGPNRNADFTQIS